MANPPNKPGNYTAPNQASPGLVGGVRGVGSPGGLKLRQRVRGGRGVRGTVPS